MAKRVYVGIDNFTRRTFPSGYTQIEYIQSSGTQYINTVFKPSGNALRVVMKFRYTAEHSGLSLFGNHTSTPYSLTVYGARPTFWVGDSPDVSCGPQTEQDVNYTLDVTAENGTITAYWNGVKYTAAYSGNLYTEQPIFIFGGNSNGALAEAGSGYRLYSFQIYDNGTLVRDFVPAKNSGGTVGLYDFVNGTFYTNAGTGAFTAGSTFKGVARRVKKMYLGAPTEVPIYGPGSVDVNTTIDSSNVNEVFEVKDETDPTLGGFTWNGTTFKGMFLNEGSGGTRELKVTLTAKVAVKVSFSHNLNIVTSSRDKGHLAVGSTIVYTNHSGDKSGTFEGELATGESIVMSLTTTGSYSTYYIQFSDMTAEYTAITDVIVGYETKDLARRAKKGYIGIGGVARPYFSSDIEYYGTITPLSVARYHFRAMTTPDKNHILFAGGYTGSDASGVVDAYDKSLIRTLPTALGKTATQLAVSKVGDYVIFAGGADEIGSDGTKRNSAYAYDSSLTRTTATSLSNLKTGLAGAFIGNHALFAGGYPVSVGKAVETYDASLTKSTATALAKGAYYLGSCSTRKYAIFAGGRSGSGMSDYEDSVSAYDSSLTAIYPTSKLTSERYNLIGAAVGNHALFAGGADLHNHFDVVDAYDDSLTLSNPSPLNIPKYNMTGISSPQYAFFGGGATTDDGGDNAGCKEVEVYDDKLTKIVIQDMNAERYNMAGDIIGDFVLFGGGTSVNVSDSNAGSAQDVVEVYTLP